MNYDELAKELTDLFKGIKTGRVDISVAHELNATATNIHRVVRLGLLNANLRGETPNLAFFKSARKKAVATKRKTNG